MNATKKFNGLASVYAAGRPTYADAFIEELYKKFGFSSNSVIADIGSGTGKLAKQIIEKGSYVYCIEPNEDMRNQSVTELEKYTNKSIIAGDAADTALQDCSVDFITTAQAFHWFDAKLFRNECKRIIKPGGKVFLIWNMRDINSDIVRKSYNIYKKYCPEFKGFCGGIKKDDIRISFFFNNRYERLEYDNTLYYDKEKFINRSLSGSYSLKQQDIRYNEYINKLEALFYEYADNNVITVPNKTIVYLGSME